LCRVRRHSVRQGDVERAIKLDADTLAALSISAPGVGASELCAGAADRA
jgi:hypothetical protein